MVHTLGTLFEDSKYKQALKAGDLPGLVGSLFQAVIGNHENPLETIEKGDRKGSYEVINRDAGSLSPISVFLQLISLPALRVCEAFMSSVSGNIEVANTPRPFVYISAEDIFRPIIPARYIETKRAAEQRIELMMVNNPAYRGVYMRPSTFFFLP